MFWLDLESASCVPDVDTFYVCLGLDFFFSIFLAGFGFLMQQPLVST